MPRGEKNVRQNEWQGGGKKNLQIFIHIFSELVPSIEQMAQNKVTHSKNKKNIPALQ